MKFSFAKKELAKTKKKASEMTAKMFKKNAFTDNKLTFADEPTEADAIFKYLDDLYKAEQEKQVDNKITGAIYVKSAEIKDMVQKVAELFSYSDLNSSQVYPTARFIELKLIDFGKSLFKGNTSECCGLTTNGGTESILFAMLAYRNLAYSKGITHPELLCSKYTHAAFQKACEMFNIKYQELDVDKNHQLDMGILRKAISPNTMCIVGSFPNYPNGIEDPIDLIGELCESLNIPFHIDACLGGMLVAFAKDANIPIVKCDFEQKGITSISCDFHKYGQCPKGISLLLYKNNYYRKFQYFKYTKLNGPYLTPGMPGTKISSYVAGSLAIMIYNGRQFYIDQAKLFHEQIRKVVIFTKEHCPEIDIVGDPKICVVAFAGKRINQVYDKMHERHWDVSYTAAPIGFHFALTAANVHNLVNDKFTKDLKECYDYVVSNPELKVTEAVKLYGVSASLPPEFAKDNLDVVVDNLID